ncbi:NHLP leader peptide family natural product precursor [Candidatus Methylospira mobilis]|uniref:NHLP leader peptide family natural product n=1 Tax=Candidatus Methylospira mobilis TaxID=1808979 RepID=A0A5Q0BM82_9GAMM|nr:NHLP leader peptide family RiPP precursor [Candidatus Methylospira mobilis]QFY43238.1 NHLP leader peptide family natural product precursor [Candidatus Methylospira mobilis]
MNEVAAEQIPEYDEHDEQLARLIAKCWADAAYKAKLLTNTSEILKEEGFEVQEGVTIRAVENTRSMYHLVIPEKPAELSDQELDGVVGGIWKTIRRASRGPRIAVAYIKHTGQMMNEPSSFPTDHIAAELDRDVNWIKRNT